MAHRLALAPPSARRRLRTAGLAAVFAAALSLAGLVPPVRSNGFVFPAVSDAWSLLPFCALMLLPFAVAPRRLGLAHLDLLALLSFALALALLAPARNWPAALAFPPLLYLAGRMLSLAGVGRGARWRVERPAPVSLLPVPWLLGGILVLCAVHVHWAMSSTSVTDVGAAGVHGARQILHGRALYGRAASIAAPGGPAGSGQASTDTHTDTYGPFNYEAYLPFLALARGQDAARLAAVFFDLLTALLLFCLAARARGRAEGVLLAYCWLAFPLGIYCDAFAFNDAILAAMLVACVLAARSPVRRGALAAAGVWTKLSPLALLGLLALRRSTARGSAWRDTGVFAGAFLLASSLIFIPVLAHGSLAVFLSRTVGFQSGRPPSGSLWSVLEEVRVRSAGWIEPASRVLHGLVAAAAATLALVLPRLITRRDIAGMCAACAAVMLVLEASLGYFAFSYVVWFAPLVLAAVILRGAPTARSSPASAGSPDRACRERRVAARDPHPGQRPAASHPSWKDALPA